jgi:hypothetical protein
MEIGAGAPEERSVEAYFLRVDEQHEQLTDRTSGAPGRWVAFGYKQIAPAGGSGRVFTRNIPSDAKEPHGWRLC